MKLPSSSRKRYLGGADWCVAALSQGTVETTGRRCIFHIAIFLEGTPSFEAVESAFHAYCTRFPILWGRLSRCWCLAPFWKYEDQPKGRPPMPCGRHQLPERAGQQAVTEVIEKLTNAYSARDGWRVALDLIQAGSGSSVLVFTFDHALFDASGAETFIQLYFRTLNGEPCAEAYPAARLAAPAQLDQWVERFKSGQTINRLMRRLAEGSTVWLPLPQDARQRPFRFRVTTFDASEVRHIRERAFSIAGYLMFTPYALATTAAVFRPLFAKQAGADAHFVVSVSTDKPKTTAVRTHHFFFNELSFLCFRFAAEAAADRNALAAVVREQLVTQAKEGLPAALENANLLMRILPARLFWRFLMRFYRSRLASFGFTCLGESSIKAPAVLGCPVREQIHYPVIPTPPGIGLILSQQGGRMHAVLSYIEGIVTDQEADALMVSFRKLLLDEP